MITAINYAATGVATLAWQRPRAGEGNTSFRLRLARPFDFLYRARQFDAKSAKFAQKHDCEFYWCPAGSIFPATAGKIEGREWKVESRKDKEITARRMALASRVGSLPGLLSTLYFLPVRANGLRIRETSRLSKGRRFFRLPQLAG